MCFIPFRWIPVYGQQQQPLSEIERSKASVSTDKVTYACFTVQCLEHKLRKPSSRKMESEGTWHAPDGDSRPREAGLPRSVTRGHTPHVSLQEVYPFDELSILADHRLALVYPPKWDREGDYGNT